MVTYKALKTFTATIYVGRKLHDTGEVLPEQLGRDVCQEYVNRVGLCVTFTPTDYIYKDGGELGFFVGLIQYPRFPAPETRIREHAVELAKALKNVYRQFKVSIVFPDETVMIGEEEKV